MPQTPLSPVEKARKVLRGEDCSTEEKIKIYRALKSAEKFGYARKMLNLIREEVPNDLELCQAHALCTFKDMDLSAEEKFDRAISILRQVEDIDNTKNQETLGLLGSIYKRKWAFDNQIRNLERSYIYYNRGYEQWDELIIAEKEHDNGYTAVNTAFVLDLLAYTESIEALKVNAKAEFADQRIIRAEEIRKSVITYFNQNPSNHTAADYWNLASMAEAYFGIQEYEKAQSLLKKIKSIRGIGRWEYDSTARQLASLAEIQIKMTKVDEEQLERDCKSKVGYDTYEQMSSRAKNAYRHDMAKEQLEEKRAAKEKAARNAIAELLGSQTAVDSAFTGKVGLALSGGGFRASLYHIGILAKLAELDVLRHIEVLSCVSGGSILGAYYYLKVMYLLESKPDEEITQDDYIQLVKELEEEFLTAVQANIRARVFDSFIFNIKMVLSSSTTRTSRIAYLYEKYFYLPIWKKILKQRAELNNEAPPKEEEPSFTEVDGGKIRMNDLFIYPRFKTPEEARNFSFRVDNWKRKNKLPNLILNATALNTGHNWQFTASFMGEPPSSIVKEVDAKYLLRRMYYHEAPGDYKNMSLGEAVAASAGVPALFEPLELKGLYPDITVQLVDGGVHDNQGVVGLLEQECKVLFVSDASGQVTTNDDVGSGTMGVALRTNDVLQGRVRESQYLDLRSRRDTSLIKEMMFVHLKKDLEDEPKDWYYCEDPHDASESAKAFYDRGVLTSYGIRKEIQRRLASVRTDLDAFHDAEAYALMYSAYEMTGHEHKITTKEYFENNTTKEGSWDFLNVKEYNDRVEKSLELERVLDASSSLLFKVFKLDKDWQFWGTVILSILGAGALFFLIMNWGESAFELRFSKIGLILLGLLIPAFVGKLIMVLNNYKGSVRSFLYKLVMAILGWLISLFIRGVYTRKYLDMGKLPLNIIDTGKTKLYSAILFLSGGLLALVFSDHITALIEEGNNRIQAFQVDKDWLSYWLIIVCFALGACFLAFYLYKYVYNKRKK